MKRMLQVIMAVLLIHAVGAAVFVGWFCATRMNDEYAGAMAKMIKGDPLQLADDQQGGDGKSATQSTSLTATDVERVEKNNLLEADIAQEQLRSLRARLVGESARIKRERDKLLADKLAWASEKQATSQQRKKDGFQKVLSLYESMKARDAKNIWVGLPEGILVAMVREMDASKVAKIFKEFRKDEEVEAKRRVLEAIRLGKFGDVAGAAALGKTGS